MELVTVLPWAGGTHGAISLGAHPTPDIHVTGSGKATLRGGDLLCIPNVKIPKLLGRDTG